jgi:hypothetical protein
MNITIDQILAKVGSQAIQIDLLTAQVTKLEAQIKALTTPTANQTPPPQEKA